MTVEYKVKYDSFEDEELDRNTIPKREKIKIEVTPQPAHKAFGNEYFIPISDEAHQLCSLLKRKLLSKDIITFLRDGGWHVVVKESKYRL